MVWANFRFVTQNCGHAFSELTTGQIGMKYGKLLITRDFEGEVHRCGCNCNRFPGMGGNHQIPFKTHKKMSLQTQAQKRM